MLHLIMDNYVSFLILLSTFLVIFMAMKVSRRSKFNNLSKRLPPGPSKLPLVGNIHHMVGYAPHRRLRDLAKTHGSVMHIQLGEISNVVISSAAAAKEVMKTHDIIFAQRPSPLAARVIFYNLTDIAFAPYGGYWRQLRKICIVELLSSKRVHSFRIIREEEVSNLVSTILSKAGMLIDLSHLVFCLINDVVFRATLGKKLKEQETFLPLVLEVGQAVSGFSLSELFPSIKVIPMITGFMSRLQRISQEANRLMENIIEDHRTRRKIAKFNPDHKEENMLDVLLSLQEQGDLEFPLTNDNIKAVILDMFLAGSETSSTTIGWTMAELMKNPEVMKKAQAEVRNVFKGKGNVDESGLENLKYLKMIVKETLRLHPPAPLLLPRESRERCEINGYEIPEKTKIIVNIFAIGRDPNYWNEPDKFYPDRFLNSSVDYMGTNFEYIPFGAGRRMCPGVWFGLANVELPLAQLLYHFDWKLPNGQKPENLDMSEIFGSAVRRKDALNLIPVPYMV